VVTPTVRLEMQRRGGEEEEEEREDGTAGPGWMYSAVSALEPTLPVCLRLGCLPAGGSPASILLPLDSPP